MCRCSNDRWEEDEDGEDGEEETEEETAEDLFKEYLEWKVLKA